MNTPTHRTGRFFGAITLALSAASADAIAQQAAPLTVSLADAIRMAAGVSHIVRTAEAGAQRARGQQQQARAQYFPQLNAAIGYQRTIQSQFEEIQKRDQSSNTSGGASSDTSSGGGNSFGGITKIFASPVTQTMTLNFSQNVFTAGKVEASNALAEAARTAAEIGLDAAKAQMALDVAQAYFDAVAAAQLADIADSTLAQAERSLQHTNLAHEVGSASEFDLLRARVARDNQKPVTIQGRGNRDIALLRLRQLLGVPLSQPLSLTTPIRDNATLVANLDLNRPIEIPGTGRGMTPDTAAAHRATVRQAEAGVEAQQLALRAAKWQRLPSVAVTSTYQRFGYPDGGFVPNSLGLFYPNWTATVGLSFPLFSGGRLAGERLVAQANLTEAEEQLAQAREFAALDARTATTQLEQSQAAYAASVGTDEQAAKAYRIAEVRQQEGISTQVELQQARTQLEQARLNRVVAAKDLEMARLRLALLKDLPLATTTPSRRP